MQFLLRVRKLDNVVGFPLEFEHGAQVWPKKCTMQRPIKLGLCLGWKGQWICCVTRGREGAEGREGRGGREGGREGERREGEKREGERREGREGEEGGRGGMTVIHIILPAPYMQTNNEELYLYNNDVTYYVMT